MNECDRYLEMMSAMLDGELPEAECAEVKAHIAECPECERAFNAFAAISGAAAEDVPEMPDGLHEKIMSAVRESADKKHKKSILIILRPYITAAACIAVIAGTLVALYGRIGPATKASFAAAPAAGEASSMECCEAPEEDAAFFAGTATDLNGDADTQDQAIAENKYVATEGRASEFAPGDKIISARITLDGQTSEIEDVDALTAALEAVDAGITVEPQPNGFDCVIDVETENGAFELSAAFDADGQRVWVFCEDFVYEAACSQSGLIAIK